MQKNRNWNKNRKIFGIILVTMVVFFCLLIGRGQKETEKEQLDLWQLLLESLEGKARDIYMPVFSYGEQSNLRNRNVPWIERIFEKTIPIYEYAQKSDVPALKESSLPRSIEESEMAEGIKEESVKEDITKKGITAKENHAEGIYAERAHTEKIGNFVPAEKAVTIDKEALQDYKNLSQCYVVDSTTYIGRDQLNVDKLLGQDMTLQQKDTSKPQILIYHTHSQEAFSDSVPGDDNTNIVGAGERLATLLREKYGFHVIHHTGKYDVESRDYAYSKAAEGLEQVLAENPSIEVVIDLHRDQMPEDTRLVMNIGGRKTARFMFFNGLSRTNRTGEIAYLKNPNLDANLAFSFQMQMAAGEYYPGLTRKIYLKGYRYNMHYRPKSLLVELGAQNNTVEEIMNACDPLAHILFLVLSGEA